MSLIEVIRHFIPWNEQEAMDQKAMLTYLERNSDALHRSNLSAHFSASAWVVNQDGTKVLMAYHKLYDSWAWLGGHADGEEDLFSVALREVKEESGLTRVNQISEAPFSLEILPVFGHEKNGCFVPSHLHMNLTYVFWANDAQALHIKADENSGVRWFSPQEALDACTEAWMNARVYSKLVQKWNGKRGEFGF